MASLEEDEASLLSKRDVSPLRRPGGRYTTIVRGRDIALRKVTQKKATKEHGKDTKVRRMKGTAKEKENKCLVVN